MRTTTPASSPITSPELMAGSQRTPWHSPVPYLFGGLAAMLGLIAFALLILACSYWKLSVQSEERERQDRDLESGNNGQNEDEKIKELQQTTKVYEEKILVIMAGDQNPTFLATPVTIPNFSSISQQPNVSLGKFHSSVQNDLDGNCEKGKEMDHHQNEEDKQQEVEEEADRVN